MVEVRGLLSCEISPQPHEQKEVMKKILFLIFIALLFFSSGCAKPTPGYKVDIPETYYLYGWYEADGGYHARVLGEIVCDSKFEKAGYVMTREDGAEKEFFIKAKVRSLGPVFVCEFDNYEFYDLLEKGNYTVKFFIIQDGIKIFFPDEFKASPAYDVTGLVYGNEKGQTIVVNERLDNWSPMD